MIKQLFILCSLILLTSQLNQAQVISNDEKLLKIILSAGQAEVTIPVPYKNEIDRISKNISIASVNEKTVDIILSIVDYQWFIQQKFNYSIVERKDSEGLVSSPSVEAAMEWESYPTYTQYDSIIKSFKTLYPSLCTIDTVGRSINGKLILAIKISDNANTDEDEPEVFYSSSIHGNETGGFILMLRLTDYLLKNYTVNGRVRNLVDNLEIWINPLANPDGTYRLGNSILSPVRGNANGYDLNRNFPDPSAPGTVRQKETLDMMRFMKNHHFVLSANFHSGNEVVNYPWDRWPRLHADNAWFYNISRKYADTVHLHAIRGYMTFMNNGVTNGYQWYSISGGRQDYVTYELHGREVTIELDDSFITPATELNTLWNSNRISLLGYLENALDGIHGHVYEFSGTKPVEARIFIPGHDKDSSHVYSDSLTGSFVRMLSPGSWDLLFKAAGYHDTLVTNIPVIEGEATVINVEMKPITVPVDTIPKSNVPVLYPNPVSSILKIVLPSDISGTVIMQLINSSGMKINEYKTFSSRGIPIEYNVRHLSGGIYYLVITNNIKKISYTARFIVFRE